DCYILLARLTDCLLCRKSCRSCLLWCWECIYCPTSDEEVEILGPFPAQTPSWLVDECVDEVINPAVQQADAMPIPQDTISNRRRSSSEMSRSTFSLVRQLSSLDARRPSSPLVDLKPIEFWAMGPRKEVIQPLRRPQTPPDDYFRKLEPRLYPLDSSRDDVDLLTDDEILLRYQLGMLHFSTQYDLINGHLGVRVIEARDLAPPLACDSSRQDMAHSNPYVKMSLLPDHKNSRQTGVKRKTQNPVFEERFTFDLPFLEAQRRTLLLSVVDFDKFSRHCVIGKVALRLNEVDLVKGGHWWKALVPSSQNEVELGELLLSLNYLPSAGRLNVDIIRAKQLLQTDMCQGSDPFVKVQLVTGLKLVKTKKTSCMKGTIDPFYNESFSFRVPNEDLNEVSLVFTVYGHNMKSSNDFVGRIVIGQFSTGPPETSHWRRLLTSQRTPVEQWHSLRSRAECDRVSPASLEVT
uniref:Synaptotagmin-17 n=1 Tax=Esox lucius TaxID=8010 RepID=A0A3P8Y733_ESOLU